MAAGVVASVSAAPARGKPPTAPTPHPLPHSDDQGSRTDANAGCAKRGGRRSGASRARRARVGHGGTGPALPNWPGRLAADEVVDVSARTTCAEQRPARVAAGIAAQW